MENYKQLMSQIRCFVFDVDGVLTDGKVTLMPTGEQVRVMNTRDGYAIKQALNQGFKVCIITGGQDQSVKTRMHYLGVQDVYLGVSDKVDALEDYCACYDLKPKQIAYMGDDMPDYLVMKEVARAACPKDAVDDIKAISHYISPLAGGAGCVREFIEQTLRTQGLWEKDSGIESH